MYIHPFCLTHFSLTNTSAKVRRLYDIANILTSLGLIKKKTFVGPHHMKKPGYAWAGPALAEIDTIGMFTITSMHCDN